jgi:hypothetical protein
MYGKTGPAAMYTASEGGNQGDVFLSDIHGYFKTAGSQVIMEGM